MNSIVITIAGGSGSGKTTVANKIISKFKKKDVRLLKVDDYYKRLDHLSLDERKKVNYDHPDSIDFDLFFEQVNDLLNGKTIEKPIYDFTIHNRKSETESINPSQVIVIEGILALFDERIRNLSDIKIFVETDADLRFIRRMERDIIERGRKVEDIVKQYINTVKPMHESFVEPTKKYADIIIPNDADHSVAVDIMNKNIESILKEKE